MQWIRDMSAEESLTKLGFTFKVPAVVQLSSLKIAESLSNNARFKASTDNDSVIQYSYAMSHGVSFPAIVIDQAGMILAGNNRVAAAMMAGLKTIGAYVVTNGDQKMRDLFVRTDNTRHGLALSEEEKIQQCLWLHETHGISFKELNSTYFGGNPSTYNKIISEAHDRTITAQLEKAGVNPDKIPKSIRTKLHPLAPVGANGGIANLKILRAVGRAILDCSLRDNEVGDLMAAVKTGESERATIDIINNFTAAIDKKRKGSTTSPLKSKLLAKLAAVRQFLGDGDNGTPITSLKQLELTPPEIKEVKKHATEIIKLLTALKKAD